MATQSRKLNCIRREMPQKRVALSLDFDLLAWLDEQPNKNRYINAIIRLDMELTKTKREGEANREHLGEILTRKRQEHEKLLKV